MKPPSLCYESHYGEIITLSPGFDLLASTPECRIQAMRHQLRPLYDIQFHPEDCSDRFPIGRAVAGELLTSCCCLHAFRPVTFRRIKRVH